MIEQVSRIRRKVYLKSGLGLVLGALFSLLAVRQTNFSEVRHVLAKVNPRWVLLGFCWYALALALRSLRWGILVRRLLNVGYTLIAEALIVGYAVNNILPARLGELFRAGYMSRQADVSRSAVLGTIVIERLLDALMVVAGLGVGLLTLERRTGWTAIRSPVLILGIAAGVLAALGIALVVMRRLLRGLRGRKNPLAIVAGNFAVGLRSLDASNLGVSVVLSLAVWIAEGVATWFMVGAVGAVLSPGDAMVLLGLAALSTLLPTAPGYVGSYQLAFAISFSLFGASQARGIAAATLAQGVLFGSVTLVGLSVYMSRAARRMFVKPNFRSFE
jgi:glycosyltransferase 2 family protein